jgi:aminopeptidase N
MQHALGVEYPGVFLIAANLYAEPGEASFIVAIAHETAHQWWYALVGNDVFADPWLDEGLATFTSSLYFEETGGKQAYQGFTRYLKERYEELRADGQDDVITRSLGYFEDLDQPRIYGGVVYTKAALFFDALREKIGDEAFFGALQQYYLDNKYGIAQPDDLLASFEAASGQQLDAFYEEWLYQVQK